jgi:hypothetical protein
VYLVPELPLEIYDNFADIVATLNVFSLLFCVFLIFKGKKKKKLKIFCICCEILVLLHNCMVWYGAAGLHCDWLVDAGHGFPVMGLVWCRPRVPRDGFGMAKSLVPVMGFEWRRTHVPRDGFGLVQCRTHVHRDGFGLVQDTCSP